MRRIKPVRPGAADGLSRADLDAILEALGDAILVQRPDGSVAWANEAAAGLLGFASASDLLGADTDEVLGRFDLLDEYGRPFPQEALPGWAALQGEEAPAALVQWGSGKDEPDSWSTVRATPIFDRNGQIRHAVNVFRDATAGQLAIRSLKRSEEHRAFMASFNRALLGASLDPAEIAERLAEVCVPTMGDLCRIWDRDRDGQARVVAVCDSRKRGGPPDRCEPTAGVLAALGGAASRTSENSPDAHEATIPIPGQRASLGAIQVISRAPRPALPDDHFQALQEVGRRAGIGIDNALLYAERARAAAVLARSLVPDELPDVPGLDLFGFVRAAASGVGGDFYDVVSLADGRSLLMIADVCGKGAEAAALTAMARYTLRTLARHHASPADLLVSVNEALADQMPEGRFCTIACGAFGPSNEGVRATIAVAGHPKPMVLRRSGDLQTVGETGLPLGIFYELELSETDIVLEPGDAFLMFTDGCVGEGGLWEEHLKKAVSESSMASARHLARAVEGVALGVQPDHPDDIAALVAILSE